MDAMADLFIERMRKHELITENETEMYHYLFLCKSEQMVTLGVILTIAWATGTFWQTILFLAAFQCIRKRTGGYHAESFSRCFICSIGIYAVWIGSYPFVMQHMTAAYIAFAIAVVLLEWIGAVNNPNIDWSATEFRCSRRLARGIVILESFIILLITVLGAKESYIVFMMFGVCLSGTLLLMAKIQGGKKNEIRKETEDGAKGIEGSWEDGMYRP